MSDEVKVTEEKECFCKSKGFRKFLVVALGTFVGVYAALCLFAALHRPPMMPPCPMGYNSPAPFASQQCPFKQHPQFNKDFKGDREHFKAIKEHKGPAPFEAKRDVED